jgi:CRP-like cAMP-binding protein
MDTPAQGSNVIYRLPEFGRRRLGDFDGALALIGKSKMPDNLQAPASANRILSRLSVEDRGLLAPHLEAVDLPLRFPIEHSNRQINYIYFIESGFASVVVNGSGERGIEVGLIGREGMTGLAVVMAADTTPHETYMQLKGAGQRIAASRLREAIDQSASLRNILLRYAHAFLVQTAHTAMANGRSKIEERLARWLLMAHDRIERDELMLTHEFLAVMLGVRRPGVTVALNLLERSGLIRTERGVIFITDRQGLEEHSNGAYATQEAEFQRLFG